MLRNQDGTPFRATGPNPLMKHQNTSHKDVELHNFVWQAKPLLTPTSSTSIEPEDVAEISDVESEELHEENIPAPSPAVIEPTVPEPKTPVINSLVVYCLPIEWKTNVDFYGEERKSKYYGQKFTFESIVAERGDLAISLWMSVFLMNPEGKTVKTIDYIKPGSVIFPATYQDGSRFGDYRWWNVQKLESYDDGVLLTAIVTDVQPSFA